MQTNMVKKEDQYQLKDKKKEMLNQHDPNTKPNFLHPNKMN